MRTVTCRSSESRGVVWQDAWSPPCEDEAERVAELPALRRLLLTTDGTMTTALAILVGEPIGVRLLSQHTAVLAQDDDELSLCAGVGVKPASDEAAHHLGGGATCWRKYLIKTGHRPLMSVDEQFPAGGFAASR
jgi:chorismate-pyruvate lyase